MWMETATAGPRAFFFATLEPLRNGAGARARCAKKNRHFFAQDADEQPNRWRSILIIFFKAIATRGFRV